jgi:hypothetical protein
MKKKLLKKQAAIVIDTVAVDMAVVDTTVAVETDSAAGVISDTNKK